MVDCGPYNFPYHELLIGVIGNVLLFTVGLLASYLLPSGNRSADAAGMQTLWNWVSRRRVT